MKLRSLRARLLAGVLALSALALVLLATLLYASQRDFALDRADDQARRALFAVDRALDTGARGPLAVPDPGPGRPRGPGGPPGASIPDGTFGEARDRAGRTVRTIVLGTGSAPAPPELPRTLEPDRPVTVESTDGSLRYRAVARQHPGGATIAAVPLSETDDQLQRLLLTEVLLVAGSLGLIGLFGWWMIGYGLRPLDDMRDAADTIAAGDLSGRVSPAEPDTEVGRLGLSLNAMLGQIEQAFRDQQLSEERLRRFLADASHELRTPLAAIRGYAELHRMGAASSEEEIAHAVGRIESESARMGTLVEDLLTLARLDERREPERRPVSLTTLTADAVSDARAADDSGRQITTTGLERDLWTPGDTDELRKVLGNLLRNALVHTPAGTPIEVALDENPDTGSARISIRDHGPGLPAEDPNIVFDRFWRSAPGRERGPAGAGLGLSIAAAVVDAHGGRITAGQAEGGGALLVVELPACDPPQSQDGPGEDSGSSEG